MMTVVVSHPSSKSKDAPRVGHPMSGPEEFDAMLLRTVVVSHPSRKRHG
jgi:prephenate dehydrogenase